MTLAILSFAVGVPRGRVTFRCDDLHVDEARDLEVNPPFADWTRAYATGYWSPEALLGIGLAIGNWLDGPQRWLTRLMPATAPVILVVETSKLPGPIEQAALDAPWELVARVGTGRAHQTRASGPVDDAGAVDEADAVHDPVPAPVSQLLAQLGAVDLRYARHMALEPGLLLTAVRRLGPARRSPEPSKYRLSVMFMAAQPDGVARLDVEREEAAIRSATGGIGMDLRVEDSGSLEGLGDLVARTGECDVIQVSCHGATDHHPALVLEGKLGERVEATASDIWSEIGQKPRLLLVSAYSSAAPGATGNRARAQNASTVALGSELLWPLSAELCQRGWPAVLGLSCTITDRAAIELAAALYRQLAQRLSLVEALARARATVAMTPGCTVWHKARLFLSSCGGDKIVDGTGARPAQPDFIRDQEFLDSNKQIRIAAADQPASYRRAFQRVVAALREGSSPGVVIHGSDDLSRASFVGRVLRRMERELRRVVVTRDFDAPTILREIRDQTARHEVAAIAEGYRGKLHNDPGQLLEALRAIIEGPCRDPSAGAFVLVLHCFGLSTPDHLLVVRALLGAFRGAATASRLLFTCATPFSVLDQQGNDLSHLLLHEFIDVSADRPVSTARQRSYPPLTQTPDRGTFELNDCGDIVVASVVEEAGSGEPSEGRPEPGVPPPMSADHTLGIGTDEVAKSLRRRSRISLWSAVGLVTVALATAFVLIRDGNEGVRRSSGARGDTSEAGASDRWGRDAAPEEAAIVQAASVPDAALPDTEWSSGRNHKPPVPVPPPGAVSATARCSKATFAAVCEATSPRRYDVHAALRNLKRCRDAGAITEADFERYQTALVAKL